MKVTRGGGYKFSVCHFAGATQWRDEQREGREGTALTACFFSPSFLNAMQRSEGNTISASHKGETETRGAPPLFRISHLVFFWIF